MLSLFSSRVLCLFTVILPQVPPPPRPFMFSHVLSKQCLCVSPVMAQNLELCSSEQLFDRWHVLTSKLVDIGWWLRLDGHRKLAICRNMLHRLRQGASAFKGMEWQDETFIRGLSICSHHIIFTLFQTLVSVL